jgi:CheY-like chemotaxis protein
MARIMIAEDDPHISRVISLWLKRNGHEVIEAVSGDKALAAIRENAPDVLVTDVNMPGMDGLELLEAVRSEALIDHQAIVLTSRCDQAEIEAQATQLGAVVHPKPFSPMQLTRTIEESLATKLSDGDAPPAVPSDTQRSVLNG